MGGDSDDDRLSPEGDGATHIPPTIYVIKVRMEMARQ